MINKRWSGITISSGVGIGRAVCVPPAWMHPAMQQMTHSIERELSKLNRALEQTKQEIAHIRATSVSVIGPHQAYIFDAHLAMIEDPAWWREWHECIQERGMTASEAVLHVGERYARMLEISYDPLVRERSADVRDVVQRLHGHVVGHRDRDVQFGVAPFVLVAHEVTPSQFVQLDHRNLRGIVTGAGGYTAHTSIMARALHVPFVMVYDEDALLGIEPGDIVGVQANIGEVIVHPSADVATQLQLLYEREQRQLKKMRTLSMARAQTEDGHTLSLYANITTPAEMDSVWQDGAEGIGLYRSECIFMASDGYPSEEQQYDIYRKTAWACRGTPLTIRTIDIGGDKHLPYVAHPVETNPAMGFRSIRMSLAEPARLVTQLRAILRASVYGDVRILLPMISHIEQLRELRALISSTQEQLHAEGIATRTDIPIGMMIEVPSAAIMAEQFAQEVQFLSIGTNDLTQFVLATDRMNERVTHLYHPYHPAVISLIRHVAHVAHARGIPVSVCGEMAADPLALPLWIGCGITQLSMSSPRIVLIKQALPSCSVQRSMALMPVIGQARTASEIMHTLGQAFVPSLVR